MSFRFLETLGIGNPWLRRTAAAVVGIYLAIDLGSYLVTLPTKRLIDLFVTFVAARVMAAGGNMYAFDQLRAMADRIGVVEYGTAFSSLWLSYTHLPTDTFFDLRWLPFDYPQARVAYVAGTALLWAIAIWLLWDALRPMAPRTVHWIWPASSLAFFGPPRASLGLGQSDLFIFFWIALAFWAMSRRQDLVAGAAVGIATLTKLIPGLFLIYFAWKREWRLLLATLGAMAVIFLVSLPVIGIDRWMYFIQVIFPSISTGTANAENQSLPGLINRLVLDPKYAQGLVSAPALPQLRIATTLAEVAVVALALWLTRSELPAEGTSGGLSRWPLLAAIWRPFRWGSGPPRKSLELALDMAIWLTTILIVAPVAWDHYFTWLILPITVYAAALLNSRLSLARGGVLVGAFVLALWLVNIPVRTFLGYNNVWQQSPFLYGSAILLALLAERRESMRGVVSQTEPQEAEQTRHAAQEV